MSSARLSDIDAAEALLKLHCNVRSGNESVNRLSSEDVESAKLFLNFVIVSNSKQTKEKSPESVADVPVHGAPTSNDSATADQPSTSQTTTTSKRKSPDHNSSDSGVSLDQQTQISKRSRLFKGKPVFRYTAVNNALVDTSGEDGLESKTGHQTQDQEQPAVNDETIENNTAEVRGTWQHKKKVETRDAETQTDDTDLSKINELQLTITKLNENIKKLQLEMEENKSRISQNNDSDEKKNATSLATVVNECNDNNKIERKDRGAKNKAGPSRAGVKSTKVPSNRNTNINGSNEMIPIGYGRTLIPANIMKHINWASYTSATRKLLTSVFSRKVLATHCLTGKQSPAFQKKPAKKMLNPVAVNDIVQTVTERCGVPEKLVRSSVTTKCADESKMFRTRQLNKKKCKLKSENILPDSESD